MKRNAPRKNQGSILASWSGLLDSNQRPHRPERRALPTALNPADIDGRANIYRISCNFEGKVTLICLQNKILEIILNFFERKLMKSLVE